MPQTHNAAFIPTHHVSRNPSVEYRSIWQRIRRGFRVVAEVIAEARAMQASERESPRGRRFTDW